MNKGSYDYNSLINYCNIENIILINKYENIKITRDTKINGKCKNCDSNFCKTFRNLKKTGPFCELCTSNNRNIKAKKTFMDNFGVENPFQSDIVKQKIKETNLKKYGTEYQFNSENFKEKSNNTCLNKYGVKYSINSSQVKEKIKNTLIQKYGVENPFQSDTIKEKIKETNLEKYGVENPAYSKEINNKKIKNCLIKYGVEHTCKLKYIIQKRKTIMFEKYNVEYPMQSDICKTKFKQTCLEKYGVENPQQNPEIAEKTSTNLYRKKIYITPSGKEIICQGYEPFALDKLIKEENISEQDIVTGCKNVPTIWYNDEQNKKHRHYVDIFIPSQNRCIEVKSTWTAEKNKDNIYLKQNAAKQLGYQYEIWIFNAKKELVEVKT